MITNKITLATAFIALSVTFISCNKDIDTEAFQTGIQTSFSAKDSTAKNINRAVGPGVYALYKSNGFAPIWITENGNTDKAAALTNELRALPDEGLPVTRYHIDSLEKYLADIKDRKNKKDINYVIAWDKKLTALYVQAANDLLFGLLDPEDATDMWYHDNDSTITLNALTDKYPSLDAYRSKMLTYSALVKARANTQEGDSNLMVIDANLERLRWLPLSFEPTSISVIIPRMEMMLKEDNNTTVRMKTVVGRPDRETPSLNEEIVNIVYNPSWGVPPGIMKKDVIPGLLNKGEGYLDKKGLKVYDRDGNEVNPRKVNAENYKQYVFRQPPSERNALGQVKFNMPNSWDIYLHDTPSKGDFEKDERYKSSGCVRLEHALDLAKHVLKSMNKNDTLNIDAILEKGDTKYVTLDQKLPVHLVYLTAYDDGSNLVFYKDIYDKDKALAAQLAQVK